MPGSTIGISENYGFPGTYSRNNYPEIRSRLSDPYAPFPIHFSDAVFGYTTQNPPIAGGVYRNAQSLSFRKLFANGRALFANDPG
jgi:hypothetical protein